MKRDLVIVLAGRVLQMAVLLLMLRAMTTQLSPTEVGNFSLLISISTLFVWILISPIGLYTNRHTLDWRAKGTVWINYGREGIYVACVSLFAAIALYLWQVIFRPVWALQLSWLGAAVATYIFFSVANTTIIPAINLFGKRIAYTVFYVATQILCLAFAWVISGFKASGEFWYFGQTAGFAVGLLLALPLFLKWTRPGAAKPRKPGELRAGLRDVMAFSLPIVVAWGLTWVQFQSYRIVIGNLVSLEFLGLFFAGYSASAGIMGAVETTAGQFFGPYFTNMCRKPSPNDSTMPGLPSCRRYIQ